MANAEIVNKLTLKTIGCGKVAIQTATGKDKESAVLLATFVGICDKTKPGVTVDANGEQRPFVRLLGQFQAVNALTGEVYQSNVALLPDLVASQIAAAVDEFGNEVEFAVQFLARYSEKAATNYTFSARPLLETKPTDKMAALLEKAGAALPMLGLSPQTDADKPAAVAAAAAEQPAATAQVDQGKTKKK